MTIQREFDFLPGLTEQFPELIDLVTAVVYGSRAGLSGVAGELDMSPSQLSRMLNRNPDDLRHLPAAALVNIVRATDDRRIIFWFMEKFLEDSDTKKKRAISELASLVPQVQRLLDSVQK